MLKEAPQGGPRVISEERPEPGPNIKETSQEVPQGGARVISEEGPELGPDPKEAPQGGPTRKEEEWQFRKRTG